MQIKLLSNILSGLNAIEIAIRNIKCSCGGQITIVDESDPLVTYYGFAGSGSLAEQAVWAVYRVTRYAGNDIVLVEWADGNQLFDNVWDNRYKLTYSILSELIK
jgi:hypothetical protein